MFKGPVARREQNSRCTHTHAAQRILLFSKDEERMRGKKKKSAKIAKPKNIPHRSKLPETLFPDLGFQTMDLFSG
jgi:hypothetical protein